MTWIKIKQGFGTWGLRLVLLAVSCLLLAVFSDARYLRYKQTDPLDIVTRNTIDRDIDHWIERLDRQIQADTLVLDMNETNTVDTVYLRNKYKDMGYSIFVCRRITKGAINTVALYGYPLSDSNFVIININALDSSTVQWMTVHK